MITKLGKKIIYGLETFGELVILSGQCFSKLFTTPALIYRTTEQMWRLGVKSLGVVTVTAAFVGMAFTLQVIREFLKFGAAKLIGGVVGLAMWRELSPLLIGVVVAGRVGASTASELATMKVTEQIEALESMSHDPVAFLVLPRVWATTLMMPLLVGFADIVSFMSGFGIAMLTGKVNPYAYFDSADSMLKLSDITGGLIKAVCFGFVIGLISSYMGLKTEGGARGVGINTTHAVVASLITIFILNYLLSTALY
jgi:phospholipid/cholesterol/gamma-HCH transport system permease protein